VIQKIMDVLRRIREVLRNSKIGNAFREGVAEKPGSFGEALGKAAKDQLKKAAGLDRSGPDGAKYTDPVKIANKVAGYADGIYQTVSYGSKGDESSRTDQELDL
jgi:hypothetical protein